MKKNMLMLIIATLLAKIGGFIKDIVLSYYYGASISSDAYIISLTIPNLILQFISVGVSTGYIPIYSAIVNESGAEEGTRFTNYIVNLILLLCTLLFIAALLFAEPLVKLFVSGFDHKSFELAVMLTRISIISIFFTGASSVFHSYLQVKNNYFIPGLIGLPANLIIIMFIVLSVKTNMIVLAAGTAATSLLDIAIVFLLARKSGHKYKPELEIKDKNLKRMASLILPAIIGSSTSEINKVADKTIASSIAEGGISALNYAVKADSFITGLFIKSISVVIYPNIAKKAAQNDMDGLKKTLSEAMSIISLIVIPATIGAVVFSRPIVELLFSRGAFDEKAAIMTSGAFLFYSLGMLGSGNRSTLVRAFYSLHDTKTPVVNSIAAMIVNLILNVILSKFLGVGGLALASSIAAFLSMSLMMVTLRKKIGPLGLKKYLVSLLKITLISLGMGLISKLIFTRLTVMTSQNLSLCVSIFIGIVIFFAGAYYAKVDVMERSVAALRKKIRNYTAKFRHFYTDFHEYSPGIIPADWSAKWANEAGYSVMADDFSERRLLRADTGSNVFNNKLIAWNTPGSAADVRVRARVRNRAVNGYQAWLAVRAGGTASDPTGYILALGAGKLEIISYVNGRYQHHTDCLFEWEAGVWYWMEFKTIGSVIDAKIWEDGTAEPDHYQLSINDSRIQSSGWIGFGGMAPGYHDCDIFEVHLK